MILPTYPGKMGPQTSPNPHHSKEIPKHQLLVKRPGAHLPGGSVGEILEVFFLPIGGVNMPPSPPFGTSSTTIDGNF